MWDRFAGFDPGLIRLTSAMRAVLGTAATLALLTALRAPETALVVGGFTAMTTSLAISELHPRNQLITLGLGLPLSLACLAVGTALTPYPTAAKLTFLVLICLAVQARRFGPRGLGLGIFGFMAFLLSQFAPARADQLPRLGASVLVAFGAVAIVWCCVGPVTGPGALRRLRHAFDVRLHDVLRDAASMVLATGQDVGTRSRSLQDRLDRLHESVLLIENLLAERAAGEDTEALRPHLSRVEVAAQRLAVLAVRAMHTPAARNDPAERTARQRLAQRIRALRYQPTVGTTRGAERCAEGYEGDSANWPTGSAFVLDCFPAVDELAEALRVLGPRGRPRARRTPSRKPASPTFGALPRRDTDEEGLKRGATRQAFQVTAASAIAITAGHLLSPHLWYWAVTAVWVVSIKNESTGEVLLQSLRRLAGTVIGVVFGYGLAALVNGDGPALLSLLLLCMFGIFYTPSHAYWAVTFFITGTLSMLLALTDTFSTQVLLLRVQETALGVSCGILAAVLVLPTTVRRAGDDALAGFLRALDHLLRAVASGSPGTETPTSRVHAAAHDLDQALESFRKAILPLTHPFAPQRRRRHRARHLLELLDAGAYHVRSLAATAERLPAGHVPEYAMRLTAAADHAHETVTHLIRVTGDRPGTVSRVARPKVTTTLSLLSEEQRVCRSRLSLEYRLVLHIDRLDSTLTALVRALDPLAPDPDRTAVAPSERVHLQLPHGPAQAAAVSCADPADRCGRARAG
ncbi:FUSC family protein [Streptomyces anthocyanicus]|uniref:FUSC family protein n=1 Tax=Streptomyces anthocyanicus TaxID=68174 RepID=UPI0019CE7B76|nr:FUSC family protein [Streptomyces anthocyanicus]GHC14559.1 FUSC family protein [Streptomyces anthocyanicus]